MRYKKELLNLTLSAAFLLAPLMMSYAQDTGPFDISAEELIYDSQSNVLKATGRIEVLSDGGSVWADEIHYDLATKTLTATGDITMLDGDGFTLFLDKAELNGKLKTAALQQIHAKLGKYGPTLIAESAIKESDMRYIMKNVTYSACPICTDDSKLPWKIRAKEVVYDKEDQNVKYKHATLDLMGVPILYTPYFRHPVGEQAAQSGLMTPRFGHSTSRGEEMTLAYYYRKNDSEDYTFRTRMMTRRGVQFQAERRQIGEHSSSEIRASVIADDKTSDIRSHFQMEGEYALEAGKRVGINTQIVSDDTYLDDFFDRNSSFLPTTAYFEDASKNRYFAVYGTRYHDLRENSIQSNTAQVLPRINFERIFGLNEKGMHLTINADVLALHRGQGQKSQRVVTSAEINKPILTKDGQKISLSAKLRGDLYHIDSVTGDDELPTRILPEVSAQWEKPFISKTGRHTFAPKAMLIAAPAGGNPSDITNEDSVAYELDASNLFLSNRFAGLDRVETGTRATYGLDNRFSDNEDREYLRLFLGQSYRFNEDSTLPNQGGTGTKVSDWVGDVTISPKNWISLKNRFRLDNSDFTAKRLDTSFTLGSRTERRATIGHTFLDGGPEEVNMLARYDLTDKHSIRAELRKDLTDDDKLLLSQGEFVYTHDCYRMSFAVRRRGFTNRNVPPSTDYIFNIELLTLGREAEQSTSVQKTKSESCHG